MENKVVDFNPEVSVLNSTRNEEQMVVSKISQVQLWSKNTRLLTVAQNFKVKIAFKRESFTNIISKERDVGF